MFFSVRKFERRAEELCGRRYFGNQTITPFISMKGNLSQDDHYVKLPDTIEGSVFGLTDIFSGLDQYLWLEKTVLVPECPDELEIVGLFDFGITGDGQSHGFESLLYINEKPYQGVDSHHREVFLSEFAGKKIKINFLLWTGLEGWTGAKELGNPFYHQCKQADIVFLHKKTDELYYFTQVITETLKFWDEQHEYYEELAGLLDRVLNCIDWSGEEFYATVDEAHELLMTSFAKMEKNAMETVHVVGHTHIDVAWLWRLKHTREKIQRSFSTVLRMMERYDEFTFLQTQPQLYKYIKEDCPEVYEKIKEKVAEGKWEPDGGMWVESDCNLISGESLVRQFLYGTRFIEKEFGKKCEYLWLPDVFGYSWAMPQIMKLCDIKTFMTTKITWNQYNQIPHDIFWWRGLDGSEILTYFIDIPFYIPAFGITVSGYGGELPVCDIVGSAKVFKNKELTKDYLIAYGFGDGGGGVNRDMLERRRVMDRIPGLPNVKNSRADQFFRDIHRKVKNTDRYVHTWDGELYLEYHRGTYTVQAYSKKMNRRLENKLSETEWLSSLSYLHGNSYAHQELNESWECVLLHQFHDVLPGSSIHEVYEDSRKNYEKAWQTAETVKTQALQSLLRREKNIYSIYSVNSFGGKEWISIQEERSGIFLDAEGKELPSERTEQGYLVQVNVQPFAFTTIRFEEKISNYREPHTSDSFCFTDSGVETPIYSILWDEDGRLTSIFDKEARRQVLKDGSCGNVLEVYEDKPLDHDAWDIEIYYTLKNPERAKLTQKPEVIFCGHFKTIIRFIYQYRKSFISQDLILYKDSRRIDFMTNVDWHEKHRLLKAAFYTDIRSVKASYDIQFGHVERPTHWNTSWDWAKFEVCAHKWADLSETDYGVSILNDCKYGYSIKDHVMKLSLLKSSKWPDYDADMGVHEFTYSLVPHMGSFLEGGIIQEANRLNLPANVFAGKAADLRKLVKLSTDHVQIDAVKKAEDEECLIIRLHECFGSRKKVILSSEYPVKRIVECNLLERDMGELFEGSIMEFHIKPFEIKTFKLYF